VDKKSIVLKIADALNIFEKSETSVKFESDDVVRIEIISNVFKDIIITKRIDMVSNAILDISMTDLREHNISIIALTENEANKGLKEKGNLITTLVSQITSKNLQNEELSKVEGLEIW
jgi:hypothetical protein